MPTAEWKVKSSHGSQALGSRLPRASSQRAACKDSSANVHGDRMCASTAASLSPGCARQMKKKAGQ
jgi:hypothetical protein